MKALKDFAAAPSARAAGIYLGWAMHMLTDLAQPHHASDKTGNSHRDYERWMDANLGLFAHLPCTGRAYRYGVAGASWRVFDLRAHLKEHEPSSRPAIRDE